MINNEDEELIAKLIQEDFNYEEYQENTFINYNNDIPNEMQQQMNQVLENANLLRWEYENNLINERNECEIKKKNQQIELEKNRRLIAEQDREYEEELNRNKPPEIPNKFICPISKIIMENPIYDEESNTHYEKSILIKYLNENNNKNHMGITINRSKLIIDNNLKQEIFYWKREQYKN